MISLITRPTLKDLQPLVNIPSEHWHKFGIEYRSVQKSSAGFVIGGQLQDGRRFTLSHTQKAYQFTK